MRSLLLLSALFSTVGTLLAQTPPVKMGLWEKKMVTSNGMGQPMSTTAKSCVTTETWNNMVSRIPKPQPNCTVKTTKNAHGYTFDGSCSSSHGMSVQFKGSSTIQDSEHIVSESHSTIIMNGKMQEMSTQGSGRFVSSDCGGIKPGEAEIDGGK